MGKDIVTEYGIIDISRDVIADLAGMATMECFGVVGMVSSRIFSDGINELLKKESLSRGVDVASRDDKLMIRVNVVVGYGSRVATIAENIIGRVKYTVENATGLTVDSVDVHIQGVKIVD